MRGEWIGAGASLLLHVALFGWLGRLSSTDRDPSEAPDTIRIVAMTTVQRPEPPPPPPITPPPPPPADPTVPVAPARRRRRPARAQSVKRRPPPRTHEKPTPSSAESSSGDPDRPENEVSADDGRVTVRPPLPSIQILPPPPNLLGRRSVPPPPPQPPGDLRPSGGGTYRAEVGKSVARVERDGTVTFEGPSTIDQVIGFGSELVQLNPMPLINAATGDDPDAAAKMRLLDETRELRIQMRQAADRENLRMATRAQRPRLEAIWKNKRLPVSERRRRLFIAWDECAETGSAEVVETARAIRAVVLAFIRRVVPRGHPDAYSDAEIARLNAERSSRARFDPYRISVPSASPEQAPE